MPKIRYENLIKLAVSRNSFYDYISCQYALRRKQLPLNKIFALPMHEDKTKDMTAEQERAYLLKIVEVGPELIRLDENARAEFKQFTSKLESELVETSRKLANILSSEQTGQIESVTAAQLIEEHTLASGKKTAELRERFKRRSIEIAKFNQEYAVVKWAMNRLKELESK